MSGPECKDIARDYLIFKNSVYRFARTLAQLDKERLRVIHVNTSEGMPNIARLAEMIDSEPGFRPADWDLNEGSGSHTLNPDPPQIRQLTSEPVGENPIRQLQAHPGFWLILATAIIMIILFSKIV